MNSLMIKDCISHPFNQNQNKDKKSPYNKNEDKNSLYKFPTRALMYSNNIGESIKPLIGKELATLSWIPSFCYAAMTINDKYKCGADETSKKQNAKREVLYQLFGSFMIPQLLVLSTKKISNNLIDKIPCDIKTNIKKTTRKSDFLHRLLLKFTTETQNIKTGGHRNLAISFITLTSVFAMAKPTDIILNKFLNTIFHPTHTNKKEAN